MSIHQNPQPPQPLQPPHTPEIPDPPDRGNMVVDGPQESQEAGPLVTCWNDGCIITSEYRPRRTHLRTGIDLRLDDNVDTRPRRVYEEGHFCSHACALSYVLRVRDNPAFYTHALLHQLPRPLLKQSLGSPYIQKRYNVCCVHGMTTDEYRRGDAISVACVYSDIMAHANQPEWLTCGVSLGPPVTTWCCWNETCQKEVTLNEAFHIPTSIIDGPCASAMSESKAAVTHARPKMFCGRGIFCSISCVGIFLSCSSSTFVDPTYKELARYMLADAAPQCILQRYE